MAERIYDQTVGQLAGVEVPTTGKTIPTRDGLEAYAQMTVSASGQPISSTAGSGNLVSLTGATIASGSMSLTANAQSAIIDTQGFEGAAFTVSGFGSATIAVQWSNLSGSGFVAGTVATIGTTTTGTTITANGQYTAASGGRYLRIITTAYASGTIVVTPVLIAGSSVGGSGGGSSGVTQIQDGTASSNAAVKAASTAPVATDPALVVAISPNGQNANGSATSANSTPVVIASDQAAVTVRPAVRANKRMQQTALTASTSETTIVTAGGSGVFNDLYGLIITNTSASDVASVTIRDATAGTARFFFAVKAGATAGFTLDGGSAVPQTSSNNNWTAQSGTSVTSLQITALYVVT